MKRKPKGTIYYAEFLSDRCGSQTSVGHITRNDLRKIAEAEKAERYGTFGVDDESPEDMWDHLMHTNDTLYMTLEVFNCDNPVRRCAAILKAIEGVNGNWGVRLEEGSVAFGLSERMALNKLDKLEGASRYR